MNKLDEHLDRIQEFEPVSTAVVLGTLSAANLIVGASRLYKQSFTKASRLCSNLVPQEKALCMIRAKMYAKKAQLRKLKSDVSKCAKTKNPAKCQNKFLKQTQKLSDEINFYSDRYNSIKKQKYTK